MRKIKFFLFVAAIFVTTLAYAQNITVTGVVSDYSNGEGVPFATVTLKGTMTGTSTDADGNYSINVPSDGTLVFTSIGYGTAEVAVGGKAVVNVSLEPDSELLDNVIIVAYGTATKHSITGAVSAVDSKAIENSLSSAVTSALEGAAPGIQVNNSYGEPGSTPTIRIRGFGSVNGSNEPLIVVDGFPFDGSINDINPNDVESMTVLKDATSAALYGNRGSNGVILITTKQGKNEGKPAVTFTTTHGMFTRGIPEYSRLGADQWMEAQWTGYKNFTMSNPQMHYDEAQAAAFATENLIKDIVKNNIYNADDTHLFDQNGKLTAKMRPGYTDLNWEDELVQKGYRQQYGVSFSNKSDKYNVFSSIDYMKEKGYIINTDYSRLSGRVNSSFTPVKWFKGGINLAATKQTNNYNSSAYSSYSANPFYTLRYEAPVYPVYLHAADGSIVLDENGEKVYDTTSPWRDNRHIVYERLNDYERDNTLTLDASVFAKFILPYGFDIEIKANSNNRHRSYARFGNPEIGDGAANNGRFEQDEYRYCTINFQQYINWAHDYGKHHIDAIFGHESYKYDYSYIYGMNSNMSIPGIYEMGNFTETSVPESGFSYADRQESYLGRARYNYSEKYFFEASFRRDGSSRFSSDKRWGNFWSVGASWDISSENFMKSAEWINWLKLRTSFGQAGNVGNIDYYAYQALYDLTDKNAGTAALHKKQLAAEDLGWETTQTFDIGVEGRLFNRLNLSASYFIKTSKNLLFNIPLPSSAGAYVWSDDYNLTQLKNIGSVDNKGWEISADVDIFKGRDFKWNFGLDITTFKNKIISLPDHEDIANGLQRYSEGKSVYEYWTYHFEGVDQMTGRSLYTIDPEKIDAAKADGKYVSINGKDYTTSTAYGKRDWAGSAIPNMFGSVHTDLSWKGLSLHVLATYSIGGKIYDGEYQSLMGAPNSALALHSDILNAWNGVPAGFSETSADRINPCGIPINDRGLVDDNNANSDRWLTDASYFMLKNITLSYSFPSKMLSAIKFKGIKINAGIENAFTLTARKGLNPQYNFSGSQDATYSTARIFSLGAVLNF